MFNGTEECAQIDPNINFESCLDKVSQWMASKRLKLNSDKTEILIAGTKQQLAKMTYNSIDVCGETITKSECVRNLGVHFDSEMKMSAHVEQIERMCYRSIREVRSIRKYLTTESTKTVVQALVTSHMDYFNSLLFWYMSRTVIPTLYE